MPSKLTCKFPETNNHFTVTLEKTIRVRNDGKTHALPPSRGQFSFYMHGTERLVPIGHEEALWFSFSWSTGVFAVKVLTGGINAITGEKETGEDRAVLRNNGAQGFGQNYMIIPGQPWLDGFKKHQGTVSQFIAVPLGKGRSVEEKLEQTKSGSIQIMVIPLKKEIQKQETMARTLKYQDDDEIISIMQNNVEKVLERDSMLGDFEERSEHL